MELSFALLADGATQRIDGKVDLFGAGLDVLVTPSVPAVHPRLVLATRCLLRDGDVGREHTVDVNVKAPDGTRIAVAQGRIMPTELDQPLGSRIGVTGVFEFVNLGLPSVGEYSVVVSLDDVEQSVLSFDVVVPGDTPGTA
jgi:hypothetical protein